MKSELSKFMDEQAQKVQQEIQAMKSFQNDITQRLENMVEEQKKKK